MQQGKKLAQVEKKRSIELAGARPADTAREKRKPVEENVFGKIE